MPKTKTNRDAQVLFNVLLPLRERDRIDGLRDRIPAKRSAIAREALRLGLDALAADPAKFVRS